MACDSPPAIVCPAPANALRRVGWTAMAIGQGADTWTTSAALQRGGVEANPIYGRHPSAARVLATKAAIVVPMAWWLDRVYRRAPPGSVRRRVALIGACVFGGLGAGAAVHNSRQARR